MLHAVGLKKIAHYLSRHCSFFVFRKETSEVIDVRKDDHLEKDHNLRRFPSIASMSVSVIAEVQAVRIFIQQA